MTSLQSFSPDHLKLNGNALRDVEAVAREAGALKRAANAGDAPLVKEKQQALKDAIKKVNDSAGKAANGLPYMRLVLLFFFCFRMMCFVKKRSEEPKSRERRNVTRSSH